MAYYCVCVVFVFVEKVVCAREGYLVYIFVDFFGSHTDTPVAHCESSRFFVEFHMHRQVAQFTLEIVFHGISLELLSCIYGIGHYFTEKNLVIAIKKLFDNGENIFSSYPYCTFCHISIILFTIKRQTKYVPIFPT